MITRDSFVSSLDDVSNLGDHYDFIDGRARQGHREPLKEIFTELSKGGPRSRIPDWALRAVLERIVEALALTEGHENALAALELAAGPPKSIGGSVWARGPRTASRVVAAQTPAVIDALLRKPPDLEMAALVLQEAVVRRKLPMESAAARETQVRLAEAKHPLALLPLTLLDLEQGVLLPEYGLGSSGTSMPFGPMGEYQTVAAAPSVGSLEMTEATSIEWADLIAAAVLNWKQESNGKVEARVFRIELAIGDDVASILPKLGLESLGLADTLRLRTSVTAKDVFTVLFSAASSGGAYSSGACAAYGRLLAWRSLAGLVGAPVGAPYHDVAADSQQCHWCIFDSPSEWYCQVAWDIGIACFNPARGEIALLAATDED